MQYRLAALSGLGRLVLRRPFPPMPDQPVQLTVNRQQVASLL